MSVLAPDSGTKHLHASAVVFLAILAIVACNTLNNKKKPKPRDTSSEYEVEETDEAESRETAGAGKKDKKNKTAEASRLPHPATASFDDLEFLFLRSEGPDVRNLSLCRKEMESLADQIYNVGDIATQSKKVAYEVGINVPFYHWCFYHTLFTVEVQLQEDNLGIDLNDKAVAFHKAIKAAWILADILDYSTHGNSYQSYLRKKYVDLSTYYFGRTLEVTTPIDINEEPQLPHRTLKPAGPAETE